MQKLVIFVYNNYRNRDDFKKFAKILESHKFRFRPFCFLICLDVTILNYHDRWMDNVEVAFPNCTTGLRFVLHCLGGKLILLEVPIYSAQIPPLMHVTAHGRLCSFAFNTCHS